MAPRYSSGAVIALLLLSYGCSRSAPSNAGAVDRFIESVRAMKFDDSLRSFYAAAGDDISAVDSIAHSFSARLQAGAKVDGALVTKFGFSSPQAWAQIGDEVLCALHAASDPSPIDDLEAAIHTAQATSPTDGAPSFEGLEVVEESASVSNSGAGSLDDAIKALTQCKERGRALASDVDPYRAELEELLAVGPDDAE